MAFVAAATLVGTTWRQGDSSSERLDLGGADLLAGAGEIPQPSAGDHLGDLSFGFYRAYDIRTGMDDRIYVLTGIPGCDDLHCSGTIARVGNNMVIETVSTFADAHPGQLAIAPDSSVTRLGPITSTHDFKPPDLMGRIPGLQSGLLSGSYTADGTLVASKVNAPEIVAIRPDGTVERLLAPTSSPEPAPVRLDSDTAALTVVALADGRIAFATNAPDDPDLDGRVYLLDGETLRPLELPEGTHPIRRIFPGPEGTLLALEGPHITQIDPDTATTNRLIDLSAVADELAPASDAWPPIQDISATAHGNDLLFTANYQVWRLPDAFE